MRIPPASPAAVSIVENRKAFHEYFIEERFEAGLVLEGWEVKAIRAGRVNLQEAYVVLNRGEPFIIGMHVSALPTASTHVVPDPTWRVVATSCSPSRELRHNAPSFRPPFPFLPAIGYSRRESFPQPAIP
jgi:hypothetical protein